MQTYELPKPCAIDMLMDELALAIPTFLRWKPPVRVGAARESLADSGMVYGPTVRVRPGFVGPVRPYGAVVFADDIPLAAVQAVVDVHDPAKPRPMTRQQALAARIHVGDPLLTVADLTEYIRLRDNL